MREREQQHRGPEHHGRGGTEGEGVGVGEGGEGGEPEDGWPLLCAAEETRNFLRALFLEYVCAYVCGQEERERERETRKMATGGGEGKEKESPMPEFYKINGHT